jgi:6-phosphofructokinase 1
MTFGFQSAVDIATRAIDEIHTTASSHGRVLIVEVMGHKVGWLPLNAGLAGGADIILLPEIPYDLKKVIDVIEQRDKEGHRFTIIAVAEGAISKEDAKLPKKEYKKKLANYKYPSVSYELADNIAKKTGREVRVTVPGHVQRGGAPVAYDRVFASRLGAEAGNLILKGEYGFMVGYKNREMVKVPLAEVAGKLKTVDPKARIIKEAKLMGVSFGD